MDARVEKMLVPAVLAMRDYYAAGIPDAGLREHPGGPDGMLDYLTLFAARIWLPDLLERGELHITLN